MGSHHLLCRYSLLIFDAFTHITIVRCRGKNKTSKAWCSDRFNDNFLHTNKLGRELSKGCNNYCISQSSESESATILLTFTAKKMPNN